VGRIGVVLMDQKPGMKPQLIGCIVAFAGIVVFGGIFVAAITDPVFGYIMGGIAAVIVGVILYFYIRGRVASSFYEVHAEPPVRDRITLGGEVEWRPSVQPKRGLKIGAPRAILRCREHAINRSGTSDTSYHNDVHKEEVQLAEGRQVYHGEIVELQPRMKIPADAVSSYTGKNNFLEWSLTLRVPVPGFCPDIKEEVSIEVEPILPAGADHSHSQDETVPANWAERFEVGDGKTEQGPVRGQLRAESVRTRAGVPVISVGGSRRVELQMEVLNDVHCRNILCWAGCRIHGSGSSEEVVITDWHSIHEGDAQAGQRIERSLDLQVPEDGPVSFRGRYIKCDWMVRVRVDIPVWRDKVLELPFVVTPRLSEDSA